MTLETAPGTQALLDLEDAFPAVLAEPLPGLDAPFWPQVRSEFSIGLHDHYFGSTSVATTRSRAALWRRQASAFIPSRQDARWLRGPRAMVYLVSGTTMHGLGSSTRNWLVGDFLEAYPERSAALQWTPLPAADVAFEPTRTLSRILDRSSVRVRLAPGRAELTDQVDRLIREYARLLDSPLGEDRLRAIVAAAARRQPLRERVQKPLLRLLDRLDPTVVLLQGGAYGTWSALTYELKRRGVHVVEPQHGWIGPSHGSYNFGAAMSSPELAAALPDELLTFGEYWSSGIRVPFATTAIGKPHLDAMRRGALAWEKRPHEILLVSSVADPEGSNDFGLALASALPSGWHVRFRPHPRELPVAAERYARVLAHPHVTLDEEPDVYVSLRTARGVVGVASTVLFEALGLGCRVFAIENPFSQYYVDDLFGPLIKGPESAGIVIEGLSRPSPTVPRSTLDAMWKPDATRNFRRWADGRLGL